MLVVGQPKLLELHETDSVADNLLREIRSVETVNAIGTNSTALYLNTAQVPLALPISLILSRLCIGQALTREARKEISGLQKLRHVSEQVERECMFLLLPCLYIVMQKIDFQSVR